MNILFLCVANSARSQIAEGLAKVILGSGHNIQSAGSQPSGAVNPLAVKTMQEIGIDITFNHSKSISDLDKDFVDNLDYVITLCAEEVCPVIISKAQKLHWANPDPAAVQGSEAEKLAAFRAVRDNIRNTIQVFSRAVFPNIAASL